MPCQPFFLCPYKTMRPQAFLSLNHFRRRVMITTLIYLTITTGRALTAIMEWTWTVKNDGASMPVLLLFPQLLANCSLQIWIPPHLRASVDWTFRLMPRLRRTAKYVSGYILHHRLGKRVHPITQISLRGRILVNQTFGLELPNRTHFRHPILSHHHRKTIPSLVLVCQTTTASCLRWFLQ